MTQAQSLPVGRLLRANIAEFVIGTRSRRLHDDALAFGALVRAAVGPATTLYGLVADIRIPDDDLVRQLTLAEGHAPQVVADQRENRIVPVEIRVLTVGYQDARGIHYVLPPRPPLSLTEIQACPPDEVVAFTTAAPQPGYLRHVVRGRDLPVADLVAAHLAQAHAVHAAQRPTWSRDAVQYLIQLLRDDYELLSQVLDAVRDALPTAW